MPSMQMLKRLFWMLRLLILITWIQIWRISKMVLFCTRLCKMGVASLMKKWLSRLFKMKVLLQLVTRNDVTMSLRPKNLLKMRQAPPFSTTFICLIWCWKLRIWHPDFSTVCCGFKIPPAAPVPFSKVRTSSSRLPRECVTFFAVSSSS
jgi:hypothetical protein